MFTSSLSVLRRAAGYGRRAVQPLADTGGILWRRLVRRFEWAGTTVALVGLMVALLGVAASDGNFGPRFGRSLAEVDFEAAGSSPGSGLGDGGAQEGGHRLTSGEAALYDSPSSTARLVQDFLPSATHGWRDLNFASLGAVGVKL